MALPRLAVQLWTFNDLAAQDFAKVLTGIRARGYEGVETHRLHGWAPTELRRLLADVGLELTSAHGKFREGDEAREQFTEKAQLGATVFVSGLENDELVSADSIARAAERINTNVELARDYGLTIGLHNHEREFSQVFDGVRAYELLLDQLDPSVVLELDMYWVYVGGADPAEVIAQHGDRVKFVHVKDGPGIAFEDYMVPVGDGTLDVDSALRAARHVGWHIVELDRSHMDPYEAIERSRRYLVDGGFSQG